jgi:stringent starvation protein B
MTTPTDSDAPGTSTRPYLAVFVDKNVQVPREYVKNNEIVLNVSFDATSQLQLGNEFIEFKARFGGSAREIVVPVDHVIAIYARENGQGMAFPVPTPGEIDDGEVAVAATPEPTERKGGGIRLASAPVAVPDDEGVTVDEEAVEATEGDAEPEPPTTPAGAGPRPSLRRVK